MTTSNVNRYWPFGGEGLDSFGVNDLPITEPLPIPKEHEVLARVDAYTICASDIKMIQMGNDYPLFKERDFKKNPARLGHELALTVVKPGKKMEKNWPVGSRFGIQPDVYLNGERFCIGVNATGGMAEYLLLGTEVFVSDNGSCAFPISDQFSAASVAQTEPLACVEAAFVNHTRSEIGINDEVLIWVDPAAEKDFTIDSDFLTQQVTVFDENDRLGKEIKFSANHVEKIRTFPEHSFDDVIVIGTPNAEEITRLTELLKPGSIFSWLPETRPEKYIEIDIAKIHYDKINLTGSISRVLSEALDQKKYRYDYKPGGDLIISGGGGAMGRIHVMRALQHENPPKRIIVTNYSEKRLVSLQETFGPLAEKNHVDLTTVSVKDSSYKNKIRSIIGEHGASDIVICAPGISPVTEIVDLLSDDGLLVLFAGTSYGHFAKMPLGLVASANVSITGSSGSSVEDQLQVVEKMEKGMLNPDINIAAIAGLYAGKDGVEAVKNRIYAGKVVVFPDLKKLPLTDLKDLGLISEELAGYVKNNGWSKKAEIMLKEIYEEGET